jgi:DNA polymerase V
MGTATRGGQRKGAGRPAGTPTKVVRLPVPIADVAHRLATKGVRMGDIGGMYAVESRTSLEIPLMMSKAACGFPSPADDYLDKPLDFNELIIKNPPATFSVRIEGLSMRDAGILPGDIAVIDRSVSPVHGCIIMAIVQGEFTIKRYLRRGERIFLHPENPDFPDLEITDGMDFEIWGVLTSTVRMF